VLDGGPALPHGKGHISPLPTFRPMSIVVKRGRPSQKLLISCYNTEPCPPAQPEHTNPDTQQFLLLRNRSAFVAQNVRRRYRKHIADIETTRCSAGQDRTQRFYAILSRLIRPVLASLRVTLYSRSHAAFFLTPSEFIQERQLSQTDGATLRVI